MNQPSLEPKSNLKLRSPQTVMRLERMGSFHHSRLSFMRVLLRRLRNEKWTIDRPVQQLDDKGVGVITYRAKGPKRTYTLVAFSHDLPDEKRSDRVIAEAWDATFALVDGEATADDIERLSRNVPLQEAGRITGKELSLSRANRSVRLFSHVVGRLSEGKQPDLEEIEKVGYLMRTTAVYGSGKFGAADRSKWADREEFSGSFQPELLSVWLTRCFALDIVEHLAKCRGGEKAVRMDRTIARRLGIGNSTGLGMAPFLIKHPTLIHAWINAREQALGRVRALKTATGDEQALFRSLAKRALVNAEYWFSDHPLQKRKVASLIADLEKLNDHLAKDILSGDFPWDRLQEWSSENLSLEGQEQVVSLMLEPYGALVDNLAATMCADESESFRIDGRMSLAELKSLTEDFYSWTQDIDFVDPSADARIWYVSEEKLEPRLGERHDEDLDAYEQPLCPGRDAKRLMESMEKWGEGKTVAEFLLKHPEHRHSVRRIQGLTDAPYGEICDNTIDAQMLPIDLLRCKLAFFGATRFDPRSDRWVRITMYQGAPYPSELAEMDPDDASYPEI